VPRAGKKGRFIAIMNSLRFFCWNSLQKFRACLPKSSTYLVLLTLLPVSGGSLPYPAHAQEIKPQQRFALLIANWKYNEAVGPLRNPKRDVDRVESALLQIGFPRENIHKEENADAVSLRRTVRAHIERVKAAGPGTMSFFYYSGHGAAAPNQGKNYVIPSGLDTMHRPDLWQQAVALEEITESLMEASEATHIVIFDACRNQLNLPTRGTKGFEPVSLSREGAEMLIAFATAPKTVAFDAYKDSENGPYAVALSEEIVKPGIDHLHLFANIRTAVMNLTLRTQVPWIQDGLLSLLVLHPRPSSTDQSATDKCDVPPTSTVAPLPIVWTDVPDRSSIRFKAQGVTYEQPRANAKLIEEVDEGITHYIANGTKISVGTQGGEVAWYRYQRDAGSTRARYVIANEAELR
jgi:hypothetical protein